MYAYERYCNKFAILKHARILLCYRKIFLMKDFSTSTKSQLTIKNRVSQLGMLAPLGGARKHSKGFKTAYRFLSCIKSAFIFGCSVSNFQRCYAIAICNSQTSKWRQTLPVCGWLQSSSENKMRLIQKKSSDWFNYPMPCISNAFKKAKKP